MKKIILFAVILWSIGMQAQQTWSPLPVQSENCYNFLIQSIDSLIIKYSVSDFVDDIDFPHNNGYCFSEIPVEQQNFIIDKVENMFNQNKYIGLYDVASQLLDIFYQWNNDADVNKRMVEIWYDKRCYVSYTITSFGTSKDYSEKTKQRLLDILAKKWTQEDINIWKVILSHSLKKNYLNSYKRDVKEIMKATNRQGSNIEQQLLDSLLQDAVERNIKININRPVSNGCILMIGSLNDQRFVPALENMLEEYKENKDYPEIKEACTYALAKLGVQKYIEEVLSNDSVIHWRYLGTKEGFLRWLDINREWNKWVRVCSSCGYLPVPLFTLWQAQDFLKNNNMPKEIRLLPIQDIEHFDNSVIGENYDPLMDEKNKSTIEKTYKLYNWIKENTDKWELPPAKDTF